MDWAAECSSQPSRVARLAGRKARLACQVSPSQGLKHAIGKRRVHADLLGGFGNAHGWKQLQLAVYDFDSATESDFMGQAVALGGEK